METCKPDLSSSNCINKFEWKQIDRRISTDIALLTKLVVLIKNICIYFMGFATPPSMAFTFVTKL